MARHVINHRWACFQEHRNLPSLEDSKGRRHSMPTTSMDAMDVHQVQDFKGLLRDVDNQVVEVTEATAEAEEPPGGSPFGGATAAGWQPPNMGPETAGHLQQTLRHQARTAA